MPYICSHRCYVHVQTRVFSEHAQRTPGRQFWNGRLLSSNIWGRHTTQLLLWSAEQNLFKLVELCLSQDWVLTFCRGILGSWSWNFRNPSCDTWVRNSAWLLLRSATTELVWVNGITLKSGLSSLLWYIDAQEIILKWQATLLWYWGVEPQHSHCWHLLE